MAAKGEDDKRLAALKAAADARRKNSPTQQTGNFPTVESAVAEIKRLNQQVNSIEAGYEKELTETRAKVTQRYAAQLTALKNEQRDEFEPVAEFNARQAKQRGELNSQRDAELARLNVTQLAAAETAPLRGSIKQLAEREYSIGAEIIGAELGAYDTEAHQFPITFKSKSPNIKLAMNSNLPLPLVEAKAFKQQWMAGLVRPEGKMKAGSDTIELVLANDADNSRFTYLGGVFLTPKMNQERQEREREENLSRPEMVNIPAAQPFFIAKTEVTQAQWRAVMGNNPSKFSSCDTCPVEKVSWDDVQVYLKKLNAKTGKQYRLPTEAEWEFACYGGSKEAFCGDNNGGAVAWHDKNSGGKTHPVGQGQVNGYGLYGMNGGVWEWTSDCYGNCSRRVLRGLWIDFANDLRVTNSSSLTPGSRYYDIGFRVARTLP